MRLSAPTWIVWLIATLLFGAAIAVRYVGVAIPVVGGFANEAMILAFILLWLGTIVRGM